MTGWNDYERWLGVELKGPLPRLTAAPAVASLVTDSRTIATGAWFIPLSGEHFDGHHFIAEAMAAGAAGFFYELGKQQTIPSSLLSQGIAVGGALKAFQLIASGWRSELRSLQLLALTGSVGKTTTKELVASILREAGPTFATAGNFNNEIGVPKSLQGLTPQHAFAVLEFGARLPGNIKELCALAKPTITALLNVGTAHLGIFGSPEALLATKLEIFRDSGKTAVQIAYGDDARIVAGAKATGKKTLTFGTAAGSDVRLKESEWLASGGMRIQLELLGKDVRCDLPVAHAVLPINSAAAAAMALAAGVSTDHIVSGLSGFQGLKGRYQVQTSGELKVIDDTYNANPESMRAGLLTLQRAFPAKRCVLVLGDMLELGSSSRAEHYAIGLKAIVPLDPQLLVTVGADALEYARGAQAAGLEAARIRSFATVDELINAGLPLRAIADVVYAKASNSIKLGKYIKYVLDEGALA